MAPWLPELAEAIGQRRINAQRLLESVPEEEFVRLKTGLEHSASHDFYSRWARWFFADRSQRTISPFSPVTVPEYIRALLEENTVESLREAIHLSPTNALAFARLAQQTLAQQPKDNPRRIGEAGFFSRRAIELSPHDSEILQIRRQVLDRIGNERQP